MRWKIGSTLACTVSFCSIALAQTSYVAIELTGGPNQSQTVHRLNLSGRSVGSVGAVDGSGTQAFLADIAGTVHLLAMPECDFSEATALNRAGTVVGFFNAEANVHAFLWNGSFHDLGTLPGDKSAKAIAINDASQVVGYSSGPTGVHAFVWSSRAGMQSVFPLSPWSEAHSISADGLIAGIQGDSPSNGQAVYRSANAPSVNLGTLPGDLQSNALSISNNGRYIVGSSSNQTVTRAFRWSRGQGMQPLQDLAGGSSISTVAFDVNSMGAAVGSSVTSIGARAAVWTPNGSVKDLNEMLSVNTNVLLTQALSINENGLILADGAPMASASMADLDDEHHAGPVHVYLLIPKH